MPIKSFFSIITIDHWNGAIPPQISGEEISLNNMRKKGGQKLQITFLGISRNVRNLVTWWCTIMDCPLTDMMYLWCNVRCIIFIYIRRHKMYNLQNRGDEYLRVCLHMSWIWSHVWQKCCRDEYVQTWHKMLQRGLCSGMWRNCCRIEYMHVHMCDKNIVELSMFTSVTKMWQSWVCSHVWHKLLQKHWCVHTFNSDAI